MDFSPMQHAIFLISIFTYVTLHLCQYITVGEGNWILRNKLMVTMGVVVTLIVLIETLKQPQTSFLGCVYQLASTNGASSQEPNARYIERLQNCCGYYVWWGTSQSKTRMFSAAFSQDGERSVPQAPMKVNTSQSWSNYRPRIYPTCCRTAAVYL